MKIPHLSRLGFLALALVASGCHLQRPGEVRPEPIPACEPQRLATLEARFEQASPAEREFLNYCRNAQAATALRATQEHIDWIADVQYIGILLSAFAAVLNFIVFVS